MRSDKLVYVPILVLLIFSIINILVCFDILPFDAWRVGIIVASLGSVFLISKKKYIKFQNRKTTIVGYGTLFIWTITLTTAFFIQK